MLPRVIRKVFLLLIFLGLVGCSTIPREVVELSYTIGQDIDALHLSYNTLIRSHFSLLRSQSTAFLKNRWVPIYLEDFVKVGGLVESSRGSDSERVLEDVNDWTEAVIETIEEKRKELIDPIDRDEEALIKTVDEAFTRLIHANATITAHLNSLRKVQEVQDNTLNTLNLKDLRDKINNDLISASNRAEKALKKLENVEGRIDGAEKIKEKLLNNLKGDKVNE